MKKHVPFVLLWFTIYCSSCCSQDSCIQLKGIPVKFSGFPEAKLDTVYTIGYQRNSGFTKRVRDTVVDSAQPAGTGDNAFVLKSKNSTSGSAGSLAGSTLPDDYDWEIYIPSVKKMVRLSNYTYLSYTCHSCPRGKNEAVQSLATVSINGAHVNVDAVIIYH